MSFDTDPAENPYAGFQPPPEWCFEQDKTPLFYYICLSGIQKGQAAIPADPAPPHGTYKVTIVNPVIWFAVHDGWDYFYRPQVFGFNIEVRTGAPMWAFWGKSLVGCKRWFTNDFQDPVNDKYYGGYAFCTHCVDALTEGDKAVMDAINLELESGTYGNPRAQAAKKVVHTYSRRFDKTNIKILYDHS